MPDPIDHIFEAHAERPQAASPAEQVLADARMRLHGVPLPEDPAALAVIAAAVPYITEAYETAALIADRLKAIRAAQADIATAVEQLVNDRRIVAHFGIIDPACLAEQLVGLADDSGMVKIPAPRAVTSYGWTSVARHLAAGLTPFADDMLGVGEALMPYGWTDGAVVHARSLAHLDPTDRRLHDAGVGLGEQLVYAWGYMTIDDDERVARRAGVEHIPEDRRS